MKNDDAELIQRTLAGDNNAFSELVKKYQKQVHALAWRKIGDFHAAEDITQDTFLKAYQRLHTLKEPHRFAGWLYVIASRRCLAWFRKKRLQKQVLENIGTPVTNRDAYSKHVAEEQAKTIDEAQQEVVKKLLETLKESDRTVITLHYFGEMTCEEMSEFLGVSANTIKSRLRRARNRMKKEEPMIREAISNYQISPNLTENIMQEINRLKPAAPTSKPLVPWVIGAASTVLIVLMLGIDGQYLAQFQKPYSLDAQSERTVELVDARDVQNLEEVSDNRNQPGNITDLGGPGDGNEVNGEQVLGDQGDYTRMNLPIGAKRRLGKGILNDMELSPDGSRLAISGSGGIWLYDVQKGNEIAFITDHKHKKDYSKPETVFSPDSKTFASKGYRRTIWLWDAETGKHLRTIKVPNAPATGYQFMKDGTWSTTVIPLSQYNPDDDGTSLIGFGGFSDKKTKAKFIVPAGPLKSFKFMADSTTLMTQNLDGTVWLWDITTGEQKATYRPKLPGLKLGSYIDWVSYSPDMWRIAADVYIAPSGEVIYALAAGDRHGTIYIQDGHTGKLIRTLEGQSKILSKENSIGQIGYGQKTPIQSHMRIPKIKKVFSHKGPRIGVEWITDLHFAPDGKTLVSKSRFRKSKSGSYSGAVELWDVKTGELLTRHELGIDIKFSGDGKALAFMARRVFGYNGSAIWDLADRHEIAEFTDNVDVKFSRDGKTFTILRNDSLEKWDIATRRKISSVHTPPGLFALLPERHAFSGDGTIFAAVDRYGTVNLWATQTDTQLRPLTADYTAPITTMAFSHDGKTLASGDGAGNIQLWDINTSTVSTTLTSPLNKYIGGLAFTTDNATLISESEGNIEEWDIVTGKIVNAYTIKGAADQGVHGASSHGSTGRGNTTFTWSNGVTALTPKGGKIAAYIWPSHEREAGEDGSEIKIWDIQTNKHLCTIKHESLIGRTFAFTSDGNMFITRGSAVVFLWNTYTGEQLAKFSIPKDPIERGYLPDIYAGVFTRDSKTFAAAGSYGNNSIFLWDIATQTHFATLRGHEHVICRLTISPDDTILASGAANGEIRLWKMPSGEHLVTFQSPGGHISNLTFAPDSKSFASTNGRSDGISSDTREGGTVFLWDVPSK
ncbi:hypothetical protein C6501_16460 [Candidatus Poribacteria bacterium]|nr:MAG: hypothetical protein C6501_16460 [Candidatus Poribacteria bacterium]